MSKRGRIWRDYLESVIIAVFLALIVRSYIFTGYKVPTTSMAPALRPGDFIFAYRLPYGFLIPLTTKKVFLNSPKHGDVVVFSFPEQPRTSYVKRVIGLQGDRIQIKDSQLSVNGHIFEYTKKNIEDLGLADSESQDLYEEKSKELSRMVLFQKNAAKKTFGPIIVPPGEVFLLGDNRDASDDSRYWGTVPIERIEAKVVLIWLSLDWTKKWGDDHFPSLRSDRSFSRVD